MSKRYSVAVIGGGYYGCYATYRLAEMYPSIDFVLFERESELCVRASSTNQGQFHRGYMYTAKPKLVGECSMYASVFESEFYSAINHQVRSYYGLHKDSIVPVEEFVNICNQYELPLKSVEPSTHFGRDIIGSFETLEKTINTEAMRRLIAKRLFRENILVRRGVGVRYIDSKGGSPVLVHDDGSETHTNMVINASFSAINTIHKNSGIELLPTRNDVFLHFMVDLPPRYENTAATVAVGDFCSLMPSNFRGSHLLAVGGVRSIAKTFDLSPTEYVDNQLATQLYLSSIKRCTEWIPILKDAKLCGYTVGTRTEYRDPATNKSMSEVKVLDDFSGIDNYVVLLGGKISCLSECLEPLQKKLDSVGFMQPA